MSEIIKDGTGNGYAAKVNELNQISSNAVSRSVENFGATLGYTFNVNTGTISLSSSNPSALLYLRNLGENDLYVGSIGYLLGNSTGGNGDLTARVVRNPSAGTIVSSAVDVGDIANKNFGSNRPLLATAYKGAEGNTLTDGTTAYESLLDSAGKQYVIATGNVVLPRGSSIGIEVTPQAGNTSMDVQVFLAILDANGFDK